MGTWEEQKIVKVKVKHVASGISCERGIGPPRPHYLTAKRNNHDRLRRRFERLGFEILKGCTALNDRVIHEIIEDMSLGQWAEVGTQ
jgi:predicted site-specific integrase-resolvase